jgi:hypothetical protein
VKIGSRIGLGQLNVILFAFLLTHEGFAQVPINGFCRYNSYPVKNGFTNLFALNFNNDSYTDLILFNPASNKILLADGNSEGGFGTAAEITVPNEISKIVTSYDRSRRVNGYFFTSRRNMKAGFYSIAPNRRVKLVNEIKFDSFPENVAAADINRDGSQEFLISGVSFNGLSIIRYERNTFIETKLSEKTSYRDAIFVDLNNDGIKDIAAVNIINSTLDYYYNNGYGSFKKIRTIPINNYVSSISSFDMDLDSYEDLIFTAENSITIMYGDYSASFSSSINITAKFVPDKFVMGDFNKDGKIDLAYLNIETGILGIFFAKSEREYHPEITYLKKEGIKNLIPFYSKFITGIALISENGNIFTVTNLSSIKDGIHLTLAANPSSISFFDSENNGVNDICFIDDYNRSLNLIIRNTAGLPSLFYSIKLFESHTSMVVDNNDPNQKIFYCYSENKKPIEIITFNAAENKIDKNILYAPGEIKDLKIKKSNPENTKIYVAYNKKNKLGLGIFEYHAFRYSLTDYPDLDSDVKSVNIFFTPDISLNYWKSFGDSVQYIVKTIKGDIKKSLYTVPDAGSKYFYVRNFTGDLYNSERDAAINFISLNDQSLVITSDEYAKNIRSKVKVDKKIYIDSMNNFFFGEIKQNGIKRLFVYLSEEKSVNQIHFVRRGKEIVITKLFGLEEIGGYFIKNLSFKNYHLVYTNKKENCITIREL